MDLSSVGELLRGMPFWPTWFATSFLLGLGATAIAYCLSRAFERFGQERLGAYVGLSIISWLPVALIAAGVWLRGYTSGGPIEFALLPYVLRLHGNHDALWIIVWSTGLTFVFLGIGAAMVASHRAFKAPVSEAVRRLKPKTRTETVVWLALVAPTAGFSEEYVFRGVALMGPIVLFDNDPVVVIAVTSLAFGLLHSYQSTIVAIGTTFMGVIAALSVLGSGSLWPAIIAHTMYDAAIYFIFPLDEGAAPAQSKRA